MHLAMHFWDYNHAGEPAHYADTLVRTAQAAEAAGFSDLTVMDHWFQMEMPGRVSTDPMLEGYTTLGFLAGQTERLNLGLMVTGVTYRHPGLLAKIVTTLDVLSKGRAFLGIGAAWYEREHHGLGVPYPPTKERFERLEETLQIVTQMWSDNDGPYDGIHYHLAETICSPQPIQQPRPPILIGGEGEKKTLRLVAQYADACNLFFGGDTDTVIRKIDVLHRHADELGRDPGEIVKTIMVSSVGAVGPTADPDRFLRDMETLASHGVTKAWFTPVNVEPADFVETLAATLGSRMAQIG
jgi:F420-dependent oxidoreductase-like protein